MDAETEAAVCRTVAGLEKRVKAVLVYAEKRGEAALAGLVKVA